MTDKVNFYVVIPNYIIEDNLLSINEKYFYSVLSNLSNKYGYCFANNDILCKYMNKTEIQIQRYLNNLEKRKLIYREYKDNKRKIYLIAQAREYINFKSQIGQDIDLKDFEEIFDYDWLNEKE